MMRYWGVAAAMLLLTGCGGSDGGTGPEQQSPVLELRWGFEGRDNGEFDGPYGIDLGPGGEIYVVDVGNVRVQVFSDQGVYQRQWELRASPTEQPFADGIAVDPDGTSFVGTVFPALVRVFNAEASWLDDWSVFASALWSVDVAVDPDSLVYTGSSDGFIRKLDAAGALLLEWAAMLRVDGIDVDASGNVFAVGTVDVDPDSARVVEEERLFKYDGQGSLLASWGSHGTAVGQFQDLTDVAVRADGNVFVMDNLRGKVIQFDPTGVFVREFGSRGVAPEEFGAPWRMVAGPAGELYITDRQGNQVFKFRVP
jgi:DNA-binding beta-propeller fold protein YncE